MQFESLTCNHCGAPLAVPETANFVKCNHCGTQLAVRRTESTTFTEQLGAIAEKTDQLADRVAHLAWQNELAAVDRAWERERHSYMIKSKNGQERVPTEAGAVFGGVFLTAFGLFWTFMASQASGAMAFFGLVFICFGVGMSIHSYNKAKDYRAAHRRYRHCRAAITPENVFSRQGRDSFLEGLEEIDSPEEFLGELERKYS